MDLNVLLDKVSEVKTSTGCHLFVENMTRAELISFLSSSGGTFQKYRGSTPGPSRGLETGAVSSRYAGIGELEVESRVAEIAPSIRPLVSVAARSGSKKRIEAARRTLREMREGLSPVTDQVMLDDIQSGLSALSLLWKRALSA